MATGIPQPAWDAKPPDICLPLPLLFPAGPSIVLVLDLLLLVVLLLAAAGQHKDCT